MTGRCRRSKERNEWREELEADHRPKVVQRRLAERGRPSYLGDAILGGMDGCVTTFAMVAGAVGGGLLERQSTRRTANEGRLLLMSAEEENKQIALSIVEALNTRDLSVWSKHLAEDYTAEHPGVSVPLNKTNHGYRLQPALRDSLPRHPLRGA